MTFKIAVCAVMLALLCAECESQKICTVPDSKLREAQQVFADVTKVFRTPRCINCHGAVNPFVKDTIHAGGRLEQVFDANGAYNPDKTFEQCQGCHGAFPDWRIPDAFLFFTGKTDAQLCKQIKESNGAFDGGFIGHVENDHGGIQFIAVAFLGTRGLNEMGQQMAENYPEPPPPDITRAGLISSARRWVEILKPYHADFGQDDCGCVPQRYVLRIEIHGTRATSLGGRDQINYEWQAQPTDFPLELGEGGTFSSSGTLVVAAREVATLPAQNVTCTAQGTWDGGKISGVIKEERVSAAPEPSGLGPAFENQLQLSGKLTWLGGTVSGTNTCTTTQGRTIVSTAKNAPQINHSPDLAFKVPAQVGPAQNLALPPGATGTITIQIIDKGIHSEP